LLLVLSQTVIASEAMQSKMPRLKKMDCFVVGAPRNDEAERSVLFLHQRAA
jgi:hypothetical protein